MTLQPHTPNTDVNTSLNAMASSPTAYTNTEIDPVSTERGNQPTADAKTEVDNA